MHKTVNHKIFAFFIVFSLLISATYAQDTRFVGKVLFDAAHAQQAGNADWVIDGGFSDFANVLTANGYQVNALDRGEISAAILKNFDILIIPEPNNPFSSYEHSVIKDFVKNGGGLMVIADHKGADRNKNGYDAVRIFNQFVSDFGFVFHANSFSENPMKGPRYDHPAIEGVTQVGGWGCTTVNVLDPERALGLIYSSKMNAPYIVASTYGHGRVVAIGDSSPFDDGTKASGSTAGLHNNFNMPQFHHREFAKVSVNWLNQNISDAFFRSEDQDDCYDPYLDGDDDHDGFDNYSCSF